MNLRYTNTGRDYRATALDAAVTIERQDGPHDIWHWTVSRFSPPATVRGWAPTLRAAKARVAELLAAAR